MHIKPCNLCNAAQHLYWFHAGERHLYCTAAYGVITMIPPVPVQKTEFPMSPRNAHGESTARKLEAVEIQNLILQARAARSAMISNLLISGYHDVRNWFGNLIHSRHNAKGA